MLIIHLIKPHHLLDKSTLPAKKVGLVSGMHVYMFLHRSTLFIEEHMGCICPRNMNCSHLKLHALSMAMTRMYIGWLWYDHDRTMRWWCDKNMTMVLPINDHEMTMTPWSCPSCIMVIKWYLYHHIIISSWLCGDRVIIMICPCVSQWP